MNPRAFVALWSLVAASMFSGFEARAGVTTFDISGGTRWSTTELWFVGQQWMSGNFDANDGVAAFAPYGNAWTQLNANRMMWHCGADGSLCPGGGERGLGPTEVYFGYSIFIKPGATFSGEMAIIADDIFELAINGQEVLADTLDANKDDDGQPIPRVVSLTPYLREGTNVFAMRAMDGYLESASACLSRGSDFQTIPSSLGDFCRGNREFEYMYVSGSVTVIPEPGVVSLVGLALVGLGVTRRRQARASE